MGMSRWVAGAKRAGGTRIDMDRAACKELVMWKGLLLWHLSACLIEVMLELSVEARCRTWRAAFALDYLRAAWETHSVLSGDALSNK